MAKPRFMAICAVFLASSTALAEPPRWQDAVGRVNSAGYKSRSHCSGALIAPDLVLTAAHCVFARAGDNTMLAPELLTFVAGWDRGDYAAASAASAIYVNPDFALAPPLSGAQAASDMAVLRLAEPITTVTPLPVSDDPAGHSLVIAGYRGDRPHILSVATDCPRTGLDGLLSVGCPVVPGNSGGPVLEQTGAGYRIVGAVSMRWGQIAFAAPVTASEIETLIAN